MAVLLAACVLLSGCIGSGPKSQGGGLIGATGGGLLAAATGARAAGMLLSGLAGSAIGDSLDQRDQEIAAQSAQRSLESARADTTSTWRNPDSGHSGSFTPTRTFQDAEGRYCREYHEYANARFEDFDFADENSDGLLSLEEVTKFEHRLY